MPSVVAGVVGGVVDVVGVLLLLLLLLLLSHSSSSFSVCCLCFKKHLRSLPSKVTGTDGCVQNSYSGACPIEANSLKFGQDWVGPTTRLNMLTQLLFSLLVQSELT